MAYLGTKIATRSDKRDIYQEVTDKIIAQMQEGIAPWARPWKSSGVNVDLPRNIKTGNRYSGVNILLLWNSVAENGFAANDWLTYKQAQELGGNVRKGERGTRIVYADSFIPKNERAKAKEQNRDPQSVFFLKGFTVFNRQQIEGLETVEPSEPLPEREMVAAGELLISRSGADIRIGGNEAFYAPALDYIAIPDQRQFEEQVNYYRTACHELCHWTGHKSRLARDLENRFGSPQYAREELIAEMGAAFTCASLGIVPTVRHADYLGSWLKVLREDNRAIFKAASAASKAADFLLAKI